LKEFKNALLWLLAGVLVIIIDGFSLFSMRLNLTVLLVFYMGMKLKPYRALFWATVIGVVLDSVSMRLTGPNVMTKALIVFACWVLNSGAFKLTAVFNSVICYLLTAADLALVYLLISVFDTKPVEFADASVNVVFQSFVNGALAYAILSYKDNKTRESWIGNTLTGL
jgi:rod shape-determining protein MreD